MREIHLRKQEDDGELVYMVIKNDGEQQNLVWLIALKNIFSKQLPNMPKVGGCVHAESSLLVA
jgi:histone acetyltransferase